MQISRSLHLWLVIHDLVFPFIALPRSLARSIEERARSYGIQRGSERANKEWNFHMGMMGWEGRKGRREGDADVPISLRVFRVANLLHVVASSPHPARGAEFKSDEGRWGREGDFDDNSSTSDPPSLPLCPSLPSLSSIVRYFRLHPLTRGLGLRRRRCQQKD